MAMLWAHGSTRIWPGVHVHLWGKKQGTQIDTYHDHDLLKPLSHFFSIPYIFLKSHQHSMLGMY